MADLVLRNGLTDVGGGEFRRADIAIENGRIVSVGDADGGGEAVD
jgi:cytosine/adenosine deaminase-related metal-dependent hydrolase